MTKTVKRNVVVSAILAIMLCVSLIAGATFALFTSESKGNIAVTSGKVSVLASIDETSVQTKQVVTAGTWMVGRNLLKWYTSIGVGTATEMVISK